MPCRSDEEEAQITELPHPVAPTKLPGNDGGGHDISDAEILVTQPNEEEESLPKKKRKCVLAMYDIVKRWVTGDRADSAEQPEEDIDREILEHARLLMHLSRLKKLPCHKSLDTNLYLWKKAG